MTTGRAGSVGAAMDDSSKCGSMTVEVGICRRSGRYDASAIICVAVIVSKICAGMAVMVNIMT